MPFPAQVERWRELVRRHAPADLRGDPEFERIALATLMAESGGNPNAVGDSGASVGLFQLHERGLGSGLSRTARTDPDTNASRAIPQLAEAYRRTGGDPVRTYTLAINPGATPDGPQVSGVMAAYRQGGGAGGGKGLASVQAEANVGEQDVFSRVVAAKGKYVGVKAVDPEVKTTDRYGDTATGPNPNPVYRYTFSDGTYLEARKTGYGEDTYEVTGGTALTSLARDEKAAGKETDPVKAEAARVNLEKAKLELEQAKRKAEAVASPQEQRLAEIEVQKAELALKQAQLNFEQDQAKDGGVPTSLVGHTVYRKNPDGSLTAIQTLPTEDTRRPDQVEADALALEKARQDLIPEQVRAFQGHMEMIKHVRGMWERGEIEPSEAEAYITASYAAAKAAIQGTTPYKIAQDKLADERARQQTGKDILNQRLASGTSLANSLLSNATSLAGKAIFRPGQSSLNFNPLADLMPTLDTLQGGADVTPFARNLLMGAGSGPSTGPTGPVVGTTASGVSVYDPHAPGVSGMRGGLPPGPIPAGL